MGRRGMAKPGGLDSDDFMGESWVQAADPCGLGLPKLFHVEQFWAATGGNSREGAHASHDSEGFWREKLFHVEQL